MHAVFMVYGMNRWVDIFLRDLEAQKLTLRMHRKNPDTGGEEEKFVWIECQLRRLPFGIYEFIFPKEHMDMVLTGLEFHKNGHTNFDINKEFSIFGFKIKPLEYLKKYLRIEDIPEFDTGREILFSKIFISIIPIGIRHEQEDLVEKKGSPNEGWWHEAI